MLSYQGTATNSGNDWYAGAQPVRLYADPGTTLSFFALDSRGTGGGLVSVSIAIYFVDVP